MDTSTLDFNTLTLLVAIMGSTLTIVTLMVGDPAFEPVAYLLVGLPFIFFVLSMREFFRSPLNQRSSMS